MSIAKLLARYALFVIFTAALSGCAYDSASAGWFGPYAANDWYGEPYAYDGVYGPDFFATSAGHFHRGGFDHFGHAFHPHAGFAGPHFGGMHIAHGGGFGGHGRA